MRRNPVDVGSNLLRETRRTSDALKGCGFKDESQVRRFIEGWGKYIKDTLRSARPNGVLLILRPDKESDFPLPAAMKYVTLHSFIKASAPGIVTTTCSLSARSKSKLTSSNVSLQQGGRWTPDKASSISHANPKLCFFWADNLEAKVFVGAESVIAFGDVTTEDESVMYLGSRAQAWGDGDLLKQCSEERLSLSGVRGIWRLPDLNLLYPNPEKRIQEILHEFFLANLNCYSEIVPERAVGKGRVDFQVCLGNGIRYFVEVKWLGTSLKKAHQFLDDVEIKKRWKASDADPFFSFGEEVVEKGVKQIQAYVRKLNPNGAWLVAYDCRETPRERDCEHPQDATVRVFQVPVSPKVASRARR